MEALTDFLSSYYLLPMRFVFVVLVFIIVVQIKRGMLYRSEPDRLLAILDIGGGAERLPILHYETTIGRSRSCDVVINQPFVSRQHAVLTMTDKGRWRITDTKSKGGLTVNGKDADENTVIRMGDVISLAGMNLAFTLPTMDDARKIEQERQRKEEKLLYKIRRKFENMTQKDGSVGTLLVALNLFQMLAFIQLFLTVDQKHLFKLGISFLFLMVMPWIYRGIAALLSIRNMTAEMAAFFLMTIGFCTIASANPQDLLKQLAAAVLGLIIFCVMCMVLKSLTFVMKMRLVAAGASILLLAVNLIFGTTQYGQTNWIKITEGLTVQPSEFVKILFIFTAAATLEWLLTTRNLTILMAYSVACIGFLFLMGDFGTALIFFFTFIVLMFMTSGDIRAVVMTCVTAGLGGLMVLKFKPYIAGRFSAWRDVWSHVNERGGFQQTRSLMGISSGGMLGLGAGNGFTKGLFASDTDIVFGIIAEEWGLIIALLTVSVYILFMVAAIRSYKTARSSYYIIAACAAASLFLFQSALNVFGTVDVLPLTGVTLPFISNGGSSIAASWGLLSFITASLNYARPKKKSKQQAERPRQKGARA